MKPGLPAHTAALMSCGVIARVENGEVSVRGDDSRDVNFGKLCTSKARRVRGDDPAGRLLHPEVDDQW